MLSCYIISACCDPTGIRTPILAFVVLSPIQLNDRAKLLRHFWRDNVVINVAILSFSPFPAIYPPIWRERPLVAITGLEPVSLPYESSVRNQLYHIAISYLLIPKIFSFFSICAFILLISSGLGFLFTE